MTVLLYHCITISQPIAAQGCLPYNWSIQKYLLLLLLLLCLFLSEEEEGGGTGSVAVAVGVAVAVAVAVGLISFGSTIRTIREI